MKQVASVAALAAISLGLISGAGAVGAPERAASGAPMVFSARPSWGDSEIFVSQDGRSKPVQITRNAIEDHSPAFSPSGERIAWARGTDRRQEIVTARLDGSHLQDLRGDTERYDDLAWSPDGRWIACAATRGPESKLTLVSVKGSAPRTLTTGYAPKWIGRGSRLVFGDSEGDGLRVFVINSDGTGRKPLTPPVGAGFYRLESFHLSVSPDGRHIAFSIGGPRDPSEIYVVGTDGSGFRKLPIDGSYPTWSPSGDKFAFGRDRGPIMVADENGRQIRKVIPTPWGVVNPQWSSSGEEIAFVYAFVYASGREEIGSASTANPRPHILFEVHHIYEDTFTWFRGA